MAGPRQDTKTGWLSFQKLAQDGGFKLLFDAELTFSLDADVLWQQMALAFTDTAKSWGWPAQYSRSAPVTTPLREGGDIRTTYTMPRRKDPSAPWYSFTYGYKMLQWKPEARTFQYHTDDAHPLNGGALVSIDALAPGRSRLHWHGVYHLHAEQEKIGDSFAWFFPIFIRALEDRLLAGPPTGEQAPA